VRRVYWKLNNRLCYLLSAHPAPHTTLQFGVDGRTWLKSSCNRIPESTAPLLRITGFLGIFIHRPVLKNPTEHNVSETGSVSVLSCGGRHLLSSDWGYLPYLVLPNAVHHRQNPLLPTVVLTYWTGCPSGTVLHVYAEDAQFESRSELWLSWLRFTRFPSLITGKYEDSTLITLLHM
jgi:hypothetical protein